MTLAFAIIAAVFIWLCQHEWFMAIVIGLAIYGMRKVSKSPEPKAAKYQLYGLIVLLCLVPVYFFATQPEKRSLALTERKLSDSEVFAVSSHILSIGKKRGCGSIEILDRDYIGKYITVKCRDGRTYNIENGAYLKIDGNIVGY